MVPPGGHKPACRAKFSEPIARLAPFGAPSAQTRMDKGFDALGPLLLLGAIARSFGQARSSGSRSDGRLNTSEVHEDNLEPRRPLRLVVKDLRELAVSVVAA